MSVLTGFDMALYSVLFLLPGFIISSVRRRYMPLNRLSENYGTTFINFIFWSMFNYFFCFIIEIAFYRNGYFILDYNFYTRHPIRTASIAFLFIFIFPIIISFLLIKLSTCNQKISKFLKFVIPETKTNPTPTAWDYKFFTTHQGKWIIVTLSDDNKIYGRYIQGSFASSDYNERDIYLSEIYTPDWKSIDRNDGILIKADYIKCIEFIN